MKERAQRSIIVPLDYTIIISLSQYNTLTRDMDTPDTLA